MKKLLHFIKSKLHKQNCSHEWEISLFQRLTDNSDTTVKCKRCGAYTQITYGIDWGETK